MSSEKRLVLTLVLTVGSVYGIQYAMERTGLIKPPAAEPPAEVAKDDPAKDLENERAKAKKARDLAKADQPKGELPDDVFARDAAPAPAAIAATDPARKAGPKLVKSAELVMGSDEDASPSAYHLRLQLDQKGASVAEATSAAYDAEFDEDAPPNLGRNPRLRLIDEPVGSAAPGSLSMTVTSAAKANRPIKVDAEDAATETPKVEAALDQETWEVVRDKDDAPAVRTVTMVEPVTGAKVEWQEVAFRIKVADPSVEVTKTYRLRKGEDGFEVELKFAPTAEDSKFTYRLYGPHGIPIEGEWYTSTFRDVFFEVEGGKGIATHASTEVVKYKADPTDLRVSNKPLKFAGVENQYFATFVQPWPIPRTMDERREQEAGPVLFAEDFKAPQKSDVGVEILSRPITLGPNLGEVVHAYRVFAGPKLASALIPYEAEDLASYRKSSWTIPGSTFLAKNVISPLLEKIYGLTQSVARMAGWKNGNYGIAIILLTMTVRMIMFPLGRKQAMMAKKMQDLQPVLAEVKEKYKDDKEALTRETMAVWKRHKVNPAAGCLPALIQMPIFVGLWQSLNNSVALRHSSFLWIRDLAAPDMVWKFPTTIPFLGDYLNVLPFLVVALMLVQMKLFSPPPTTPEAEMNQKMMKYMMVVMAFMFYKVPSGLGLYFITSSLWQICERLLLPKVIHTHAKPPAEDDLGDRNRGGTGGNGNGNGNGKGPQGWLGKRLEKLLEEAAKDKTIRNDREVGRGSGGREREREPERDRTRPRPKPGPGKRR
jgi:YidC/Oxa1 family membrane protein insertase